MGLTLRFSQANQFILSRIQDDLFKSQGKEQACTQDRIEVGFYRFKASQY